MNGIGFERFRFPAMTQLLWAVPAVSVSQTWQRSTSPHIHLRIYHSWLCPFPVHLYSQNSVWSSCRLKNKQGFLTKSHIIIGLAVWTLCAASQFLGLLLWFEWKDAAVHLHPERNDTYFIFSLLRRCFLHHLRVWHSLVAMATTAITQKGLTCIINGPHMNAFGSIPFQFEEKAQTLNGL